MKVKKVLLSLVAMTVAASFALAQDAAIGGIDRAYKHGVGTYLVADDGMALYVRSGELDGTSACYDDCATQWPPALTGNGMETGGGVDSLLLGATTRNDSSSQFTYAGLPLYRYSGDAEPGDIKGLASNWFLISPDGSPLGVEAGQFRAGPATSGLNRAYKYGVGTFLIDAQGFSVYAFSNDELESTCYDECARNWPPLLSGDEVQAGQGLDPELLGSITRDDGTEQLTYAGQPLYRFSADTAGGTVAGQNLSDSWHLLAPDGSRIGSAAAESLTDAAVPGHDAEAAVEPEQADVESVAVSAVPAEVMAQGATVYGSGTTPSCASCHGAEGEGLGGPRLADNSALANNERIIRTVLRGGHIMPAFGDQLNDERVASVLTFVRNSWGNELGEITPDEVNSSR